MNKYYILSKDYSKGDIQVEGINSTQNIDIKNVEGSFINKEVQLKISFKNKTGRKVDYPIGGTFMPIVSKKLKECISSIENQIQFIHLESDTNLDFWFLNILNNVNALDWNKSDYEMHPEFIITELPHLKNKPSSINKFVVNHENVNNRNVFRAKEWPTVIFVSELFKNLIESEKLTGIELIEIDDYNFE